MLSSNIANVSKKRKFSANATEKLDAPTSRHKCGCLGEVAYFDAVPQQSLHSKDTHLQIIGGKDNAYLVEDNKCSGDSCFECTVVQLNVDKEKAQSDSKDSTWFRSRTEDTSRSLNSGSTSCITDVSENPISIRAKNHELNDCVIQEVHVDEIGSYMDCFLSGLSDENNEKTEDEVEDFLYSGGLVTESYMFSTNSWARDEKVQQSTVREPTIDQEFEEYFASLML